MLDDLHRRRGWHLDHLASPTHMDATQPPRTLRAVLDRVRHHLGRFLALPRLVVLRRALLARRWRFAGPIRLHEGGRRLLLRFQFRDPLLRCCHLLRQRLNLLLRRLELERQLFDASRHLPALLLIFLPLFVCQGDHAISLPDFFPRSSLNTYSVESLESYVSRNPFGKIFF